MTSHPSPQRPASHADLPVRFLDSSETIASFCRAAQSASFLSVDTEFMRERTYYPQLCLVQVATDSQAVVIDALAEGVDLAPLWALLLDTPMPKVFHAASQDLEIFAHLAGGLPAPLFDTQVAAMVVGLGDQIGYDKLIKETTSAQIDKSSRYSDWAMRPLDKRQVTYAAGDVTHLRDAYLDLQARLNALDRQAWVAEEMAKLADLSRYQPAPEAAYKRLKARTDKPRMLGVLRELAAWRELDAQRRDVPRGRVVRDDTLLDVAAAQPTSVDALKKIRGVSDGLAEGKIGKHLIQAVNKGLALPADQLPTATRKRALSDEETARLSLLRMLLSVRAAAAGTASRLLATNAELEALARLPLDAWADSDLPCLSGWRAELFGRAAHALVQGKLWLGFDNGRVSVRQEG